MIYIAISLFDKEKVNTSCLRSVYEGISYFRIRNADAPTACEVKDTNA
jgi:hypothetical protein